GEDLSRTQFIEIWLRTSSNPFFAVGSADQTAYVPPTGNPVLHVDIGDISENAILDPPHEFAERRFSVLDLNNEDRMNHISTDYPDNGYFGDGRLNYLGDDPIEDVGLDGCSDPFEDGLGGCLPEEDPNFSEGDDPNDDNYEFNYRDREGTVEQYKKKYNKVNGTENNRNDGEIMARPDTEDLNNSGRLDRANNYYSYAIDLTDETSFLVDGTFQPTSGFALYRIPIKALGLPGISTVGSNPPSFNQLRYLRMWIDGAEDSVYVYIAEMNIVGNDWEEKLEPGQNFEVTVKNTQDNIDYFRPPTVTVEIDPLTGVAQREQSLVLKFSDLKSEETFLLERIFPREKDLTDYEELQMYIHGPTATRFAPWQDHMEVFLRLGLDSTVYYEVRVPRLMPGWDERNYISVLFDSLTGLKLLSDGTLFSGIEAQTVDGLIKMRGRARGSGASQTVSYPALSNIRYMALGVRNNSDHTIAEGEDWEVWFDDMRLTQVRTEPGSAYRGLLSVGFADFARVRVQADHMGIGFGSLNDKRGRNASSAQFRLELSRLRLDKLLPPAWGLILPFDISWSSTKTQPRLKPGTDIKLLTDDDKAQERGNSSSFRTSFSYSKSSRARNRLLSLTLDRLDMGVTYSAQKSMRPQPATRDSKKSYSYSGRIGYDLTPREKLTLKPFDWTSALMPEAIAGLEIAYLPTSLQFNATTSFSSDSTFRVSRLATGDTAATGTRNFTMKETYKTGLSPVSSLTTTYNLNFSRDLSPDIDESEAISDLAKVVGQNIFRGNEISRQHSFSARWQPRWPTWFSHGYAFRTTYGDNSDRRTTGGLSDTTLYNIKSNMTISLTNATLQIPRILKAWDATEATTGRPRAPRDTSGVSDSSISINLLKPLRTALRFVGDRLDPISGGGEWKQSFKGNRVGGSDRPGLGYQ
ncbi:MAG: cell surface protein SprA, partial [Candidatus Latescibacteria bacterium]|nr:cell surface protein SprA [Candidatus Latescibacterota bacterium]